MPARKALEPESPLDIVGRAPELATLSDLLADAGPRIMHVSGIPGIGKSTLIRCFSAQARDQGAAVHTLDCREIEPTPDGLVSQLARALSISPDRRPETFARQLSNSPDPTILALDGYEAFRLLDTWFRQTFVPALPDHVRILFIGRHQPAAGWFVEDWGRQSRHLPLERLALEDAADLLSGNDMTDARRREIATILQGHPLALRLAASLLATQTRLTVSDATLQNVMTELTGRYLDDVSDATTRRLVEGAALVRRVTVPLLAALFPEHEPESAYRRLADLTFTEFAPDGLRIHDAVREPIAKTLDARNPETAQGHRRTAWRKASEQAASAGRPELWRHTADMLYLIRNPIVREAFFPSTAGELAVERAHAQDTKAIIRIIELHEGPEAAQALLGWWRDYPDTFVVVRDAQGRVRGLCCRFDPRWMDEQSLNRDPVTATWLADLEANPLIEGKRALFIRRWLDETLGERPGDVQAACWLDLKRTYMEMRPDLQRVYLALTDLKPYAAVARELGFRVIENRHAIVDRRTYLSAKLDFGRHSVDGWLAELAAAELGLSTETVHLNDDAHEFVVDGQRIGLSPLEYGVLRYLIDGDGRAVSREELLRGVWGSEYTGWSNKVDAVVAGLRSKLGNQAKSIETVRGIGYRFNG